MRAALDLIPQPYRSQAVPHLHTKAHEGAENKPTPPKSSVHALTSPNSAVPLPAPAQVSIVTDTEVRTSHPPSQGNTCFVSPLLLQQQLPFVGLG